MNKNLQIQTLLVDLFNAKYKIGDTVVLRKDSGKVKTKVTGEAFLLGGHTAVAFFEEIPGCYAIGNRVEIPLEASQEGGKRGRLGTA